MNSWAEVQSHSTVYKLRVLPAGVKLSHVGVGSVLVVSSRHFDQMHRVERTDGDGLLLDSRTDR
jgi:hypothetical protein